MYVYMCESHLVMVSLANDVEMECCCEILHCSTVIVCPPLLSGDTSGQETQSLQNVVKQGI